jgi:hypothetical protein
MWNGFGTTKEPAVEFCERCGSVCDRRCRADELVRETVDQVLRQGWRLA